MTKYGLLNNALYEASLANALVKTFDRTHQGLDGKDAYYNTDTPYECAELTAHGHATTGASHYAIMGAKPEDFIFDRIWIVPSEINARLITADDVYDVSIWNAFQKENKYFTSVASLTPEGTSITTPTLPRNLQPTAESEVEITIYKIGPSIQRTTYYLTIGGTIYEVDVRGLRVMVFSKLLNWSSDPQIIYTFETSIFQTDRAKEQRRSKRDIPLRTLKGEYMVQNTYGQRLLNRLQYGHDKLFAAPIVDEALIPTSITTGGTAITLSNSTADKWNFVNLCSYIGIYQPNKDVVEIHEVDSYTTDTITTRTNIVETYDIDDTVIFPVFFGTIQTADISPETDSLSKISIEYVEKQVNV